MGDRDRTKTEPAPTRKAVVAAGGCLLACAVLVIGATQSFAQSIGELNGKISAAKSQAQELGAQIDATSAELAATQQEAIAAAQREAQLSAVLATGEERER